MGTHCSAGGGGWAQESAWSRRHGDCSAVEGLYLISLLHNNITCVLNTSLPATGDKVILNHPDVTAQVSTAPVLVMNHDSIPFMCICKPFHLQEVVSIFPF